MAVASGSKSWSPRQCREAGQAGGHFGVTEVRQTVEYRARRAQVRQALLGIVAVQLEVLPDQAYEQSMTVDVELGLVEQDLAEGLRFPSDPGAEGGDQDVAADEVVLKGQQAEEEVLGRVLERWGSRVFTHQQLPRRVWYWGSRYSSCPPADQPRSAYQTDE
jgi:hypothetical protein